MPGAPVSHPTQTREVAATPPPHPAVTDFLHHDRRLDAAVSLGIISDEQAARIRALVPERPAPSARAPLGGSVIAYALGAITVLIAMGWFLADRWDYLGAGGVLAVVLVYAALFSGVARRLHREGFPTATGIAALLAVATVPLAVIALSELFAWFPQAPGRSCSGRGYSLVYWFDFWTCRGLEVSVELATVAAAAFAWRLTRFSPFALVIGALGMRFVFHAAALLTDGHSGVMAMAWLWMICTSLAVAVAYELDRREPGDHDVALWLHLLGAIAAAVTSVTLLNQIEALRHLLLPAAFVAFTFSLRMRRGIWTLLGLAWFVAYLGWLANEVFRDTPVFPIVLAALGIAVIVVTVWVQRNRERLAARVGGLESGARPSYPGGLTLLLLPIAVALWHLPSAVALDEAQARENRAGQEARQAIHARERREAQADSVARETAPRRRP